MWVCAYACMCYSYVWMHVFMRLSQATNVAVGFSENEFKCILMIRYIIYLGHYSYGTKHYHCMSGRMNNNLIC